MTPVRQVVLTDVLLRDGLQLEKLLLPTATKIRLARGLVAAGFGSLEVGAFVKPDLVPQMADTPQVLAGLEDLAGVVDLHTLVFTPGGAARAVDAGARHVRVVVSASDGHSRANAGVDTARALERVVAAVDLLTAQGVRVEGSVATAFVCPFDGPTAPERVAPVALALRDAGARVVHLADTIGAASPTQVRATLGVVGEALGSTDVGLHLHNTYGMASAVVWEALALGVRRFDAALGGLGGCPFAPGASGNVATDDLVNLLHHAGVGTGVDVERLTGVRDELGTVLGRRLDSALARVPATPVPLAG